LKDTSVRSTSAKPAISIKALVVYNLMDLVANQKGGGQGSSKTSSVGKGVPPKSSVAPAKGTSSSSAEAGKSMIPEKAKIQDKNVAAAAAVPDSSGSNAKIQDKTPDEGVEASAEAQIQDKDVGEAIVSGCLSSCDKSELCQIAANLRPLSDRSGVQLPHEPQILARDVVSPSRGGELFLHSIFETMQEEFLPFDVAFDLVKVAEGSSLACDKVPANTFIMSAQAVEPFVTAANRIRLPQVEEELMLQCGGTLYKSLLSSQVKSLTIIHASLRQYRELSRMKADRDSLRKDLSVLETKVEKLDASLTKARNDNDDLRGKVDAAAQELAAFSEVEKLRLSAICGQIRDALVSVGSDSSDFSLSEFATPKPSADASLSKCVTLESSSEISLSEFATPEPSSC
ncbi:hypothetical protein EJB05_47405, partial [Eragrostis curvula]